MEFERSRISGWSLIGDREPQEKGSSFYGRNPSTGDVLEPEFYSAIQQDIELAASLAQSAFPIFASTSGRERAALLRGIADGLAAWGEAITGRAHLETGLPIQRLQGELGRTTGQLRMFADLLEEGSWVNARIDEGDPKRKPLPRPDLRSMLRPIGPVAVFGASNFPLAFSVAGGDTASALAAGNPVIVKAHPAHPGTSELAGRVIQQAVRQSGLPPGVFALLFDAGIEAGTALAQNPSVKAIAFTGSTSGGLALMRLAAQRPEPIPCYAEMGSTNPMFILPGAMRERAAQLAKGTQTSFTMGSGQFCTKPGVVFVPAQQSADFLEAMRNEVSQLAPHGMLTQPIATRYTEAIQQRQAEGHAQTLAGKQAASDPSMATGSPMVFTTSIAGFLAHPSLAEEVFGPATLLVHYGNESDLVTAARQMNGHLTATIHGTDEDIAAARELIQVLETKVGRILFNGYPTGVEVNHAMVHGGPFPATSDGRSTSVGTQAIFRFVRPVCYQEMPDALLPIELKRANSLRLTRLVNGSLTRDR